MPFLATSGFTESLTCSKDLFESITTLWPENEFSWAETKPEAAIPRSNPRHNLHAVFLNIFLLKTEVESVAKSAKTGFRESVTGNLDSRTMALVHKSRQGRARALRWFVSEHALNS